MQKKMQKISAESFDMIKTLLLWLAYRYID